MNQKEQKHLVKLFLKKELFLQFVNEWAKHDEEALLL